MKSQIILTSAAAVLLSVTGANAFSYRPFVGLTMGLQNPVYSDSGKDMEHADNINLANDFFAFGAETGVMFCDKNCIYNGGLTVSATKTTYSDVDAKFTEDRVASMDLFNISMTYDNYIRISGDKANRIDLVIGAGAGAMAIHVDPVGADDDTVWSFAPEAKLGLNFELSKNWTLTTSARVFFPTRSHYMMDASYILGGGIRYLF